MDCITTLAWKHFLDPIFRLENNLTIVWEKEDKNTCYEYWLAVFEHSNTPIGLELKEKVQKAGIPYKEFCRSIVDIYFTLDRYCYSSTPGIYVTSQDITDALELLNFSHRQYECLKILLSLPTMYRRDI